MACIFSVEQVKLSCEGSGGRAWILDWISKLWSSSMGNENVKKNQADLKASLRGENIMWQRGHAGDFIPALVGVLGAIVEKMCM